MKNTKIPTEKTEKLVPAKAEKWEAGKDCIFVVDAKGETLYVLLSMEEISAFYNAMKSADKKEEE